MRALFSDNKCLVSIQENPYWAREANDCRPTGRTHISGRSRPGLPWGKAIKQDPDCPGRSFARVQPQMSIDVVSNLRAKPQDQPPSGDRPPASASNALKYTDWLLRVFYGVDRVKVLHITFPRSSYSMRRAFIGSMLAARRAGMNPAKAAEAASIKTAPLRVTGS